MGKGAAVAAAALFLTSWAAARGAEIETLAGAAEGEVLSIGREGDALVLTTSRGAIPCAEVKEVRFADAAKEPRGAAGRVFLANGDELAGEVTAGDDAKITIRTASLGPVEVKLEAVRGVVFSGDDRDVRAFRRELLPGEAKADVVLTRAGSRTEGVLDRIDERGVTIEAKGLGKVTLSPEKALAVRVAELGKPPLRPQGLLARLDLADGGSISGALQSYKDGVFRLDWIKPGLEVRGAEVRVLSFSGGKFVYLSDLVPTEAKQAPKLVEIQRPFRPDRTVLDTPLRLDGRSYRRGIGVKAATRLTYDLAGKYERFRAKIGLDDFAREQGRANNAVGDVVFQVLVDGKPALGEKGLRLTTRDPARPLDIDVAGAKALTLIADFGESQDILSFGDWADAHLVLR
jgi:hypothetical protein